jgi:hypothetical protein
LSIKGALNATIYSALNGKTTAAAKVYYLLAPDNTALPYIVWDYVNEGDDNATPRRAKNAVLFIRAYASTPADANTIDAAIDTELHDKVLTITGWTNFWTARENGMSTVEVDASGRKTYMAGADYRIRADK